MARKGKELTPSRTWRLGVAGGIVCAVLLLDQLTKLGVRAAGESLHVTVIPGVLDVTFVRNTGAAFSFGEGHGILFVVLAVVVVAAVAGYLVKSPELSRTEVAGLALVCGGAVGNAIDRLFLGYVTDFIATTFIDFPVFNIADIAITCGVAIAFVGYIFLSPAVQNVDATAELNARDEARAARRAKKRGERAKKMRERGER